MAFFELRIALRLSHVFFMRSLSAFGSTAALIPPPRNKKDCSSLLILTNLQWLTAFLFSAVFLLQILGEFTILEYQLRSALESYCCSLSAAALHSNVGDNIIDCCCPSLQDVSDIFSSCLVNLSSVCCGAPSIISIDRGATLAGKVWHLDVPKSHLKSRLGLIMPYA